MQRCTQRIVTMLRESFRSATQQSSGQHAGAKRWIGNLPVKPNSNIEKFASRRENIEREFKWDGPTLRRIVIWGLFVPYGVYSMTVAEFDKADEFGKKPKRDMWGSVGSNNA